MDINFPHRLFVPEHYEPGYAYPLIVWLHSDASSEMELDNVMPGLSLRNYVAIAPRANVKSRGVQHKFRWGTSTTDCAVAEDLVWDCVQAAMDSLSIHPDRIFLAGFGGGATMAQWIGLKYARQVAGVVSLSGEFPKTKCVLSNWKQARDVNVLYGQRPGSTLCSDEELYRTIKTTHQSGLNYQFVRFDSNDRFSSEANELNTTMLEVANRFLMGIVTGSEISLAPEISCDSECVEFGVN
jgi:phospholipase/carboxylesterase